MKRGLSIALFCLICNVAIGQVRILDKTSDFIEIAYYNDSNVLAYFSNPTVYLFQKRKNSSLEYSFRKDMVRCSCDTLFLYLTDTTLNQLNGRYKISDSIHKSIGFISDDSIPPHSLLRLKIYFKQKFEYKVLVIRYNFTFKREEYFNTYGKRVRELIVNNF